MVRKRVGVLESAAKTGKRNYFRRKFTWKVRKPTAWKGRRPRGRKRTR